MPTSEKRTPRSRFCLPLPQALCLPYSKTAAEDNGKYFCADAFLRYVLASLRHRYLFLLALDRLALFSFDSIVLGETMQYIADG